MSERTFKLTLPVRSNVSKNKIKSLNMNIYRNLHYQSSNYQKKHFSGEIKPQLKDIPKLGKIVIDYVIFAKNKRKFDTMNVGSIVDKYFCDALVTNKIIADDTYDYVLKQSFCFGGIADIAKVEVTITEIEKPPIAEETETMRIFLDEAEINTALQAFVQNELNIGESTVDVTMVDGQIQAEIVPTESPTPKTKPKVKNKGGRPKGSKNKPKEEPVDADTETDTSSDNSDSSGSDKPSETKTVATTSIFDEEEKPETTSKGDKNSKNRSKDSPEVSSQTKNSEEETTSADTVEESSKVNTSIFDDL